MKIDRTRLDAAFILAQKTLDNQSFSDFMKNRWFRGLEKARQRILEQPYFAWQPEQLTIVSIPAGKSREIASRFYRATNETCSRLDKIGYCQAFFEGFPCWHRAAFLLLSIYFDKLGEIQVTNSQARSIPTPSVNRS